MDAMALAFRNDIETFLKETGMSPTYFGKAACGNSELVSRLRAGRTVTTSTIAKCQEFMKERRK